MPMARVATGASGDSPDAAAAGAPRLRPRRPSAREVNGGPSGSREIKGIQRGISATRMLT